MRVDKVIAAAAALCSATAFSAHLGVRVIHYQSPFADYRRLEQVEDPSETWRALNDEAVEPAGHVDFGTRIDQSDDPGAGKAGDAKPDRTPILQPSYMKQIVHRAGPGEDKHLQHRH